MQELFLHIGSPKTGTTSIQNYFSQNREVIKHEISYPLSGLQWGGHHMIASLFKFPNKDFDWIVKCNENQLLESLKNEIKRSISKKTLISSEVFFHCEKVDQLKRTFNALGYDKIKIVVFLKRQDVFAESVYKQLYKTGNVDCEIEEFIYPNNVLDSAYNYYDKLKPWIEVFGSDNVQLVTMKGNSDALSLLLEILGVKLKVPTTKLSNVALPLDLLRLSHVIHKHGKPHQLYGRTIEYLEQIADQSSAVKYKILPSEIKNRLIKDVHKSNRALANEFGLDELFDLVDEQSDSPHELVQLTDNNLESIGYALNHIVHKYENQLNELVKAINTLVHQRNK